MFRTALISMFLTSTALADTWTVDDDGKADFDNIQAAVDAASDGDEIIVMPGIYISTTSEVVNPNGKELWIHSNLGSEYTFIDGETQRRGFLFDSNETSATVIDGFTIMRCVAENGGGAYIFESSPTIENCNFINNTSNNDGAGAFFGYSDSILINCTFSANIAANEAGGLRANWSNLTLNDCTFTLNSGDYGGALYCWGSSPVLTNCIFTNNTANYAGAMRCKEFSNPVLTNCEFTGNTVEFDGGAMHNKDASNPTLTGCNFVGNTASYDGGGVYNSDSNPTLTNCFFEGNTSTGPNSDGGGIYNLGSDPTLTSCIFEANTATNGGGGVCNDNSNPAFTNCTFTNNAASSRGGGISNLYSNSTLVDCVFINNTGGDGGGMRNYYSSPTLDGCTFESNHAGLGGGIYNLLSTPLLDNCTFEHNTATYGGGGMRDYDSTSTINSCTFQYNSLTEPNSNVLGGGIVFSSSDTDPTLTNTLVCENTPDQISGNWIDGGGNTICCDVVDADMCRHVGDVCEYWSDINNNGILDVCELINGDRVYYGGLIDGHYASRIGLYGFAVDIEDETMAICAADGQSIWGMGGAGACVDIFELNDDSKFTKVQRILNPEENSSLPFHTVSIDRPFLAVGSWNQGVHIYQRFTFETDPMLCYGDIEWREIQIIVPEGEWVSFPYNISLRDGVLAISHFSNSQHETAFVQIYHWSEEDAFWQHVQEINLNDINQAAVGASEIVLNGDRMLVFWSPPNFNGSAKSDILIFKQGKDGLFELEQNLDFPFWEFPETLEGGYCRADIDGNRLVVMDYGGWSGGNGYEYGPNGIWTYAYNENLSQWEYEQELVDDIQGPWDPGWQEVAIAGDLVFSQEVNIGTGPYFGNAIRTWRASDNNWDLISRTGIPFNHGSNYIFFPSTTIAASGNRCITTSMISYACYGDTTLINMDADNDGVLDVDQILLDPEIDSDNSGVPDNVEPDCNNNGVADSIDIYFDPSLDANGSENGTIDSCEQDSDANGIPDWAECSISDYNLNDIDDWLEGDCDDDGIPDVVEIYLGMVEDNNNDWIPDVCQCLADISEDGEVNVSDILILIAIWGETCTIWDTNGDNLIDVADLLFVISHWGDCP